MDPISASTGTKFINNMPFIDEIRRLPMFQQKTATTPAIMDIYNSSNRTVTIVWNVGTEMTFIYVSTVTVRTNEIDPNKHVSVV